ncbi:MAG TPA: polysaccharide pyruvyl transferase CsaB, partial [Clostridiales bacterium]|nr:polysaccharide pyruvyl transferase CsaB [Clostridiales bacterium]
MITSMKVLHLSCGGDIGGAKTHILSLISELGKHIQVSLVSLRKSPFASDAAAMGIDTRIIRTRFFAADLIRLVRIIRRGRFDIVHAHGSKANVYLVLARLFTRFIPVTTVHSDYRGDYLHSFLKHYTFGVTNRIALQFIGNYIAVSGNFKRMLVERGFPPSRIHTVYNGMRFDREFSVLSRNDFYAKHQIHSQPGDILIGIVARLHPVKGVEIFVKAAAHVLKKQPKARFIICGDGDQRKNLELLARSSGILHRLHFLGHVEAPWEALQNLDINVLTSYSESFPYAILE